MASSSNSQVLVTVLLSPVAGLVIGAVAWSMFATPCDDTFGTIVIHKECLGAFTNLKAAVAAIGSTCTVLGWLIAFIMYVAGAGSDQGAKPPA